MKKAFTILELIFVIVIIGILSIIAIPKLKETSIEGALKKTEMNINKEQIGIQNKLSSNILSGNKSCPDLEKSLNDDTVFENIIPIKKVNTDGLVKIDTSDGKKYTISIQDKYNFDITYDKNLSDGCKLKCTDTNNCPINIE